MMKIGERIKYYRQRRGLSLQNMAEALSMSSANYAKYESGLRSPREDTLIQIAKALQVQPSFLEEGEENVFIALLNRHVLSAVLDETDTFECFVDDLSGEVYDVISSAFGQYEEQFSNNDEAFAREYITNPTLSGIHKLYKQLKMIDSGDLKEISSTYEEYSKLSKASIPEEERFVPPLYDDISYYATLKAAFCVAMTNYLIKSNVKRIFNDVIAVLPGKDAGFSPLQLFAVSLFVPYIAFIVDTVEEIAWNLDMSHFFDRFLISP